MQIGDDAFANGILYSRDGIAAGSAGPVCIILWRKAVTLQRFNVQSQALDSIIHRNERASLLCIVEPSAEPPDEPLRKASVEMVGSRQGNLDCVACVIEGTGFKAAMGRSVLGGMAFFLGPRHVPVEFFAHTRRAAIWTSKHSGVPHELIMERIDQLRYALQRGEHQDTQRLRPLFPE